MMSYASGGLSLIYVADMKLCTNCLTDKANARSNRNPVKNAQSSLFEVFVQLLTICCLLSFQKLSPTKNAQRNKLHFRCSIVVQYR
jgi:hypothetical protein